MDNLYEMVLTIICSVIASSGFWAYVTQKANRKDVSKQMLIGLGHDRIMTLGLQYIERGWISTDEFENLNDYLYKPYVEMGGNGSASRLMKEVEKLPFRPHS